MYTPSMPDKLIFSAKFVTTFGALILVTAWIVDTFHMLERITSTVADLCTKVALELSNTFSLDEFARVSVQFKGRSVFFLFYLVLLHVPEQTIFSDE